jgi:mannose-6-phosphate isomerase-like protein (cupin superfamily)
MSATLAGDARNGVRLTVAEVEKTLPDSGLRSVAAFEHGTMLAKLYAPQVQDLQKPHTRDEVYIVASGTGTLIAGEKRHPFGPGDFLFVPAQVVHRFENFSDDFKVWVVFYGPEGGERP